MKAKELTSIDDMVAIFPVLSNMYPDLSIEEYKEIIPKRKVEGYRMVGVFDGEKCVCAAGFWVGVRFYCGKFIQLDNMVSMPEARSKGAGKMLVDWIKAVGKTEGCNKIILDTYVENFEAHKFFLREDFLIRGYHLNYNL